MPDVDAVCVAKMFQISNHVPDSTQIAVSTDLTKFAVGFVVAPQNKDAQWAKDLVEAYTSPAMKAEIAKLFQGSYVIKICSGKGGGTYNEDYKSRCHAYQSEGGR